MPWRDNLHGMANVVSWRGTYKMGFDLDTKHDRETERLFFWICGQLLIVMDALPKEEKEYKIVCECKDTNSHVDVSYANDFYVSEYTSLEKFVEVLKEVKKLFTDEIEYEAGITKKDEHHYEFYVTLVPKD